MRQRLRLRTRKSARFLPPVAGSVSHRAFDFPVVRQCVRGRVLRAPACVAAKAFACEAARATALRPHTRESARLRTRALPVAVRVSGAFDCESDDACMSQHARETSRARARVARVCARMAPRALQGSTRGNGRVCECTFQAACVARGRPRHRAFDDVCVHTFV